jgi:hypothetical protein
MQCPATGYKLPHDFQEIHREDRRDGQCSPEAVVRWCSQCGKVLAYLENGGERVVGSEVDHTPSGWKGTVVVG